MFIRNIYEENEPKEVGNIKDITSYYYEFERFLDLVPVVKQALECPQWIKEKFEQFMENDLYWQYPHLCKLKEVIDEVQVKKVFGKCDYLDKIICFILFFYDGI